VCVAYSVASKYADDDDDDRAGSKYGGEDRGGAESKYDGCGGDGGGGAEAKGGGGGPGSADAGVVLPPIVQVRDKRLVSTSARGWDRARIFLTCPGFVESCTHIFLACAGVFGIVHASLLGVRRPLWDRARIFSLRAQAFHACTSSYCLR